MQASIEHKLADVHHRLGDWDLAEAHLAVVTELVTGAEPGRLARAEADRAVVAYRRGDTEQAAAFGRAALSSAQAAADPGAMAQALNVLGMLAARAGQGTAAETYLRDSLAEARQLPELGAAVAALNNLARLLAETGRIREALALAAEALELGSELGDQHRVAALHTNMADLLHADGQGDAAMTHLKEAARRFASVDVGGRAAPGDLDARRVVAVGPAYSDTLSTTAAAAGPAGPEPRCPAGAGPGCCAPPHQHARRPAFRERYGSTGG